MRYAVVPAGGLGTRSGLVSSKELALVAGIPVIEYIFARLQLAQVSKIFVTTSQGKTDLIAYLTHDSPCKDLLSLSIGPRLGLLDGIISPAKTLESEDELYFGLPDTVWFPADGFAKLSEVVGDLVLGLLPTTTPELYGSVTVEGNVATSIVEKPAFSTSPWIWAFGKFKAKVAQDLLALSHAHPVFTNTLGAYAQLHPIKVVTFASGKYFDTGTPAGLSATNKYVQN